MKKEEIEKANHAEELKALGGGTMYLTEYTPSILEAFKNKYPGNDYEVHLDCPEFTHICPKTGQPDWAHIQIWYRPNDLLVESKSLKLYLGSFRSHGSFHENCINQIGEDLWNLMKPKWLKVYGKFNPRGGISINPTFERFEQSKVGPVGTGGQ